MGSEAALCFAAWADIGSLAMFLFCVYLIGVDPQASTAVWTPSKGRSAWQRFAFISSITWILLRVIVEGVTRETGPREFMLIHVTYLARWAYLKFGISSPFAKGYRLQRVARELRRVQMLRVGLSTFPSTKGQQEVVIRRGCRSVPEGPLYWRGVIQFQKFHVDVGIYEVHLLQPRLHADSLDGFGGMVYVAPDRTKLDCAYKRFYDVVLSCVAFRTPTQEEVEHQYDEDYTGSNASFTIPPTSPRYPVLEVDFSLFTQHFGSLPVEASSMRNDATDPRMIGRVARTIAADALAYIQGGYGAAEFRTAQQVDILNECLRNAAATLFPDGLCGDIEPCNESSA